MYPYGGGQSKNQNLIWQDRRDRNIPVSERQQQHGDNWWNKIKKKSISATETTEPVPTRVFSMDKGMLGGRAILNIPEKPKEHQLFNLENLDEGPTRPQLNLGDIGSQFSRPPFESSTQAELEKSDLAAAAPVKTITPLKEPNDTSKTLYQIPLVNPPKQTGTVNQAEFKTVSETEIIKPPSPFMDLTRRRPPPVPKDVPRPQSFIVKNKYEHISVGKQRGNFVKDAVSLFEKNTPTVKQKIEPEVPLVQHMIEPVVQDKVAPPLKDYINIKIPNKAANTRQRSRGPSRTPSDLDLSRQASPTGTEPGDISISKEFSGSKNRLSKSYDPQAPEMEASFSRDPSFSDATSLDSKLDSLEPQVKEKKASVFRGLLNATRSKINLDTKLDKEKSNTDPSRRKLKRSSSSAKPVKSEICMDVKTDLIPTNSNRSKYGKKRKPSHLELQQGFNVKGFDNFMMY